MMGALEELKVVSGYIEICEKRFNVRRAWQLDMISVENPDLIEIQNLFDAHDLAHTSIENTILYLIKCDKYFQLLWVCTHFEDSTFMNIVELCGIMSAMTRLSTYSGVPDTISVSIILLDMFAEKLIILIDGVHDRILY